MKTRKARNSKSSAAQSVAMVGIPDDCAVSSVRGRLGAANGPEMFRRVFAKLNSRSLRTDMVLDHGDVVGMSKDVNKNHVLASQTIARIHEQHAFSIVVGGSHDHGYSQVRGIAESLGPKFRLGCLNIDAHLDVRKPSPEPSSGSPFYLAIESGVLAPGRLIEFGIQSHCNSQELWDYVALKKIRVVHWATLRRSKSIAEEFKKSLLALSRSCDGVVVSFDLDAVSSAFAPGVSAPQAEGLNASDAVEIAEISGAFPKVVSLGIFELNPNYDPDMRTARLAATLAFHALEARLGGRK